MKSSSKRPTRAATSRKPEHFDRLYSADPDPWKLASSDYERKKYAVTLSALGARRFENALEVGCSIGTLTELLAPRCDRLLAVDFAPSAVAQAGARCAHLPRVSIRQMEVPRAWPADMYDLVVLSEVLYFFSRNDLEWVTERVLASTLPGAAVLLVNYTGMTDDPLSGEEAAELFLAGSAKTLVRTRHQRAPGYRLDLLVRQDGE